MCAICHQAIIGRDLHEVSGTTICVSARGCIMALVYSSTQQQLQQLQAGALRAALAANNGSTPPGAITHGLL